MTCIRDADGRLENFLIQVTDVTRSSANCGNAWSSGSCLPGAIADGRLVAYAQPIVDARTGAVVEGSCWFGWSAATGG